MKEEGLFREGACHLTENQQTYIGSDKAFHRFT